MNLLHKISLAILLPVTAITTFGISTHKQAAKVSISTYQSDSTYGPANLFDAGTKAVLVSKQFEFTEGPSADNRGNVYFTDQPNNSIWKYGVDGQLSLFTNNSGRANGTYFDKQGNLVACADDKGELWRYSRSGKDHEVILSSAADHRFNGPNDLWIDSKGGIYFTDPYYKRSYWTDAQNDLDGEKVFYLPHSSNKATVASTDLEKPNGIAGTLDGKHLFVADIKAGKIYKFDIGPNGELSNRQLFANMGSDGMTIDDEGNVYLTGGKGVTVYNSQGQKVGLIQIPEPWTANVCFGGKDRNVLFIMASKAVYTFQMKVKGSAKNAGKQR